MFFPESLFLLSQRDAQVSWLDPANIGTPSGVFIPPLSSNAVGTDGSVSWQVPQGRALILQHVHCFFQPGGVQISSLRRILVRPAAAGTTEVWLHEERNSLAAGVGQELTWQGSIILPERWYVQGYGEFNGGVANELVLSFAGLYIPLGNIQRI